MSHSYRCTQLSRKNLCSGLMILWLALGLTACALPPVTEHHTPQRSVTLIDPTLTDTQSLVAQLPRNTDIVWLDNNLTVASALATYLDKNSQDTTPITELHLLTHGAPGQLKIQDTTVEVSSADAETTSLWSPLQSMLGENADIYIYACRFGGDLQGKHAVKTLADITGATVHASSDVTGHESLGGNWSLEVSASGHNQASTAPKEGLQLHDYTATLDIILNETLDPNVLIETVVDTSNTDMIIHSVTVVGNNGQIATFTNGLSVPGFVAFDEGIVISSGQVSDIHGPNNLDGTGTDVDPVPGADGDTDFNTLSASPQGTFDAAYIEISFTPAQDQIKGTFVFASEEYNEYAPPSGSASTGNTFYDAMAFFVNGVNYSVTAAGDAVSINTVNESLNAADFYSNDREDDGTPTPYNIEPDGFTRKLVWAAPVNPGVPNTLKFGVADGGDAAFDSWLMIDKYSFEVLEAPAQVDLALTKTDRNDSIAIDQTLDYRFTLTNTGPNATGREITVTDTLPDGITVNNGAAEAVQEFGRNAAEWTCQSDASTPQTVTCKSTVSLGTTNGNNESIFGFTTDPVPASTVGNTLTNTATVSTSDLDLDSSNDFDADTTLVTSTDISSPSLEWNSVPALVADTSVFSIELSFNENVTGFTLSDLVASNATLSNLTSVDASTYTVLVTPDGNGDIAIVLPADAVQDAANNGNSSSSAPVITYDSNSVELTLLDVPVVRPNTTAYTVIFDFADNISGFDVSDIAVSNGTVGNFQTTDSSTYSADITPDGTGDIAITVPAAAAATLSDGAPTLGASGTTSYNISAPTVAISNTPAIVNTSATFTIDFEFSEDVTTFDAADIAVTNATLDNFQAVDGANYTVDVTPDGGGDIEINIPADAAIDIAGNGNAPALPALVDYDIEGPVAALVNLPERVNSTVAFTVEIQFDEPVSDLVLADISVTNGSATNLLSLTADNYTVDVTPDGTGDISLQLPAGVVSDTIGNTNTETALSVVIFDDVAPVLTLEPVAGDNYINAVEDNSAVTVSGSATGLENNQPVIVTLNGQVYPTTVSAGIWSVSIPASDIQSLSTTEQLTVDASDLAGNAAVTINQTITHDTTPPVVPTVTSVLTNSLTPTLTGTATVGAGETLEVSVDGESYTAGDGHLLDNGDGTWTLSIPSTQILDEQSFDVVATVTDTAGNASTDTSSSELEIDATPPTTPLVAAELLTADDTGSSDSDAITSTSTPIFSVPPGTLTVGDEITLYASGVAVATTTVLPNGDFSTVVSTLADGVYGIRYTATDAAGNTSELSPTLALTIDTSMSVPVLDSPVAIDNIVNAAEADALIVTGTAEANATIELEFSDGGNTETATTSAGPDGVWSLSTPADISSLADGTVTLTATATDLAGNSNSSAGFDITLDATAPATPTVTALSTNNTAPTLSGTADPGTGGDLGVSINGINYPSTGSDLTDNGDGTWTLIIPGANALSQATYDVVVTVTDNSGNATVDTSSDELTVDTTAPAVPVVTALLTNSDTPTLSGTAARGIGEQLAVTVDGITYLDTGPDLSIDGDGNWLLSIPTGAELADGTYSVDAVLTDAAGNASADATSNELEVDTVAPGAPTVTVLITQDTTPVLTGTATLSVTDTLTVSVDSNTYTAGDGNLVDNGDGT
nr:choice-of-anchor L domain-containing protein [Gammaproteobacteria bacterium]